MVPWSCGSRGREEDYIHAICSYLPPFPRRHNPSLSSTLHRPLPLRRIVCAGGSVPSLCADGRGDKVKEEGNGCGVPGFVVAWCGVVWCGLT